MNDFRFRLLCDYLNELQKIKGLAPLTSGELLKAYASYVSAANTKWIDIFGGTQNNEVIGFLIIGYPPNCHPGADFYIEEAFIKPELRRQGVMSFVASEFIRSNPGIYCLFILNRNETALRFWHKLFAQCGYAPHLLSDVGAGDEHCKQYGFKKMI